MVCGAAAEAREPLGGGGQDGLGVGRAIEQREQVEDFLGLEAGAFDAQLVHGGLGIREAAEIDADGGAARGRLRARRRAAGSRWPLPPRQDLRPGARGRCAAATFSSSALAQRAGDVASQQLPQRLRIRGCLRWFFRSIRALFVFSALPKGFFNHGQGALGDLQFGEVARGGPIRRAAHVVAGTSLPPVTRQSNRSGRSDIRARPSHRA